MGIETKSTLGLFLKKAKTSFKVFFEIVSSLSRKLTYSPVAYPRPIFLDNPGPLFLSFLMNLKLLGCFE